MDTIGSLAYDRKNGNYIIHRGSTDQGYVYKNESNFKRHKDRPCYVPELSDDIYTGNDFVEMCNGQKDIAALLFESVDWQSPGTLLDEWMDTDEIVKCERCGKLVLYGGGMEADHCPYCNAIIGKE